MKNSSSNDWSMVIKPRTSLFEINYKELWDYRDLVMLLVKRDFISFYKQTIFGPIWFFIQPIFTTVIFVFIFGNLAGFSTDGLPQPLFYMTGVVSWNYFADCLNKTSTVFKDNANIFGKVYFPRLIMPVSIIISNLARFAVQFCLLIALMLYYVIFTETRLDIGYNLLLVPVFICMMALLGLGAGMIISAMTTKYRDLAFLVTFGVQLLMYATPVIYPLSSAPGTYKDIISLNPMSHIIEGIRLGLLGKGDLTPATFFYSLITILIILVIGVSTFNKVEKKFVDTV